MIPMLIALVVFVCFAVLLPDRTPAKLTLAATAGVVAFLAAFWLAILN